MGRDCKDSLSLSSSSLLSLTISTRLKWRQQRRLDPVDSLLDREMREQEYEWSNYETDEYEAKVLVADSIFDTLLHDTIESFQISFIKKNT